MSLLYTILYVQKTPLAEHTCQKLEQRVSVWEPHLFPKIVLMFR